MHRPPRRQPPRSSLSFSDRVAYATFGAVCGAIVGFVLLWLLGVYSNTVGPTGFVSAPGKLVALVAFVFAAIGFIFGSSVGSAVGNTISAIYELERASLYGPPAWVVVLVLAAVAGIVVWYALR